MRVAIVWFIVLVAGAVATAYVPDDFARLDLGVTQFSLDRATLDQVGAVLAGLSIGAALRIVYLWLVGLVTPRRPPLPADTRPRIVVDGSNVMFWDGETPTLRALTSVLDDLLCRGFAPVVYFDANVGYQLWGGYRGPDAVARKLPRGLSQVVVVDRGVPADPMLIDVAMKNGLRIVSNDRFRDWRGQFPRLADKGMLVPGTIRGGQVTLRL